MAYETGSSSGVVDLLQKLATWLATNGWTINYSGSHGNGWRLHVSSGAMHVHLKACVNEGAPFNLNHSRDIPFYGFCLYAGSGWSGSSAEWYAHPGGPAAKGTSTTCGAAVRMTSGAIPSYHFFDDGDGNIFIAMERSAGSFRWMSWGFLSSAGVLPGTNAGQYFSGSESWYYQNLSLDEPPFSVSWDAKVFIRADVDSYTGKWLCLGDFYGETDRAAYSSVTNDTGGNIAGWNFNSNAAADYLPGEPSGIARYYHGCHPDNLYFQKAQTSVQSLRPGFLPFHLWAARDSSGYSLLGTVPSVYYSNAVGNGYAAGEILQIESDSYVLFPHCAVKKVA